MNSRLSGDWWNQNKRPILEGEGVLLGDIFRYPAQDFHVDQAAGSALFDGLSPESPKASIQSAINLAVNGRGDRIWIKPGTYEENLDTTGKDCVHLYGVLAGGYARPNVAPASGSALKAGSQGVVTAHMRYVAVDAAAALVQEGNGFRHDDCVFDGDGNTGALIEFHPVVDDDGFTASEGVLRRSYVRDSGGVGILFVNPGPPAGVGPTGVVIEKNIFVGNADEDIKDDDTVDSNDVTFGNGIIRENDFMTKDKAVYIDLSEAPNNTGFLTANRFAGEVNTTTVALVAGIVSAGNFAPEGIVGTIPAP